MDVDDAWTAAHDGIFRDDRQTSAQVDEALAGLRELRRLAEIGCAMLDVIATPGAEDEVREHATPEEAVAYLREWLTVPEPPLIPEAIRELLEPYVLSVIREEMQRLTPGLMGPLAPGLMGPPVVDWAKQLEEANRGRNSFEPLEDTEAQRAHKRLRARHEAHVARVTSALEMVGPGTTNPGQNPFKVGLKFLERLHEEAERRAAKLREAGDPMTAALLEALIGRGNGKWPPDAA